MLGTVILFFEISVAVLVQDEAGVREVATETVRVVLSHSVVVGGAIDVNHHVSLEIARAP